MKAKIDSVKPMISVPDSKTALCASCVFYPPNLPAAAYPAADYRMLQEKICSFDFQPADSDCVQTRKTSCSLLDLEQTK